MQSSSTLLPSSVHAIATLTECAEEAAVINDSECCDDHFEGQSKKPLQAMSRGSDNHQIVMIATVGAICMLFILSLSASAFGVDPSLEPSADCTFAVTSEALQLVVMFTIGWACCFISRRQEVLAEQVSTMICLVQQLSGIVHSSAHSVVSAATCHYQSLRAWSQGPNITKVVGLGVLGTLCSGCIFALFISAFTAVSDEASTDEDFGSESSTLQAFAIGWVCMLSFKLRRELVGSSCMLEPF